MSELFHVQPTLRFAYKVKGRRTVLTRSAAYNGAKLAAVAKRCDCWHGSGEPDDPSEQCDYHATISPWGSQLDEDDDRRADVLDRLVAIYKAEDEKKLANLDRPELDLSHMRLDDLEKIQFAIDWHLANGAHRPRRRS